MGEEVDSASYRFDRFCLDPADRLLTRDGVPVELNARYLDALVLMVRQPGRLVSKDRFLAEVWRGVPVTDEALTQCIRTLRRALGDDAARPRLIETVPKHGYRFIADVQAGGAARTATSASPLLADAEPRTLLLRRAGTLGSAAAGLFGGLFYGFAATVPAPGGTAISMLLVLVAVTVTVAFLGGAGVAFGIGEAYVRARGPSPWAVLGGAAGGMLVGAVVKLVGLDALALLVGRAPPDMTGAPEGMVLGAAVGLAAWLATRTGARRGLAFAGLIGAGAGMLVALLGGHMLGGSLALLVDGNPGSRLSLTAIGELFGERGFGPISAAVTAAIEGALFSLGVVGGMEYARRRMPQALIDPR